MTGLTRTGGGGRIPEMAAWGGLGETEPRPPPAPPPRGGGGLLPIWPQWEVWRKPKAAAPFRFRHSGHIGHIGQTLFSRACAREGQFPVPGEVFAKHLAGMDDLTGSEGPLR